MRVLRREIEALLPYFWGFRNPQKWERGTDPVRVDIPRESKDGGREAVLRNQAEAWTSDQFFLKVILLEKWKYSVWCRGREYLCFYERSEIKILVTCDLVLVELTVSCLLPLLCYPEPRCPFT